MFTGPKTVILKGDRAKSQRYIGLAKQQMGRMIAFMNSLKLKQQVWRRTYPIENVFIKTVAVPPNIYTMTIETLVTGLLENCLTLLKQLLGKADWEPHYPPNLTEKMPKMAAVNPPTFNKDPATRSYFTAKDDPHVLLTLPKEGKTFSTDGLYTFIGEGEDCFDLGNPWHGVVDKFGRLLDYTGPQYNGEPDLYSGDGANTLIVQKNPVLSYTGMRKIQEYIDFDAANNHSYTDYVFLTGNNRTVAQKPLGTGAWIYFDDSGKPWVLQLNISTVDPDQVRVTINLVATIGRYSLAGNIDTDIGKLIYDRTFLTGEIDLAGRTLFASTSLEQSSPSLSGQQVALSVYATGSSVLVGGVSSSTAVDMITALVFEISGSGSFEEGSVGEGITANLATFYDEDSLGGTSEYFEQYDYPPNPVDLVFGDSCFLYLPNISTGIESECIAEVGDCCQHRVTTYRTEHISKGSPYEYSNSWTSGRKQTVDKKIKVYFVNETLEWVRVQHQFNWSFSHTTIDAYDDTYYENHQISTGTTIFDCTLVDSYRVPATGFFGTRSYIGVRFSSTLRETILTFSDGRTLTRRTGRVSTETNTDGECSEVVNVYEDVGTSLPAFYNGTTFQVGDDALINQYGGAIRGTTFNNRVSYNPLTDQWADDWPNGRAWV